MKPEELMIGDWVQLFPDQCRVDGIICLREEHTAEEKWIAIVHLGGNKYERVNIDMLEPIPLTSEILEKNGFVFHHDIFNGIYPMVNIIYRDYKLLVDNGKYINGGESNDIEYVHELQHALKFCGIEKKIAL